MTKRIALASVLNGIPLDTALDDATAKIYKIIAKHHLVLFRQAVGIIISPSGVSYLKSMT